MFGWKRRRRQRWRMEGVPSEQRAAIARHFRYFSWLPPQDQAELLGHARVLLEEKHFEGCGGLALDDDMKAVIAGQAAALLLHRDTDYFPELITILVYPHPFVAEGVAAEDGLGEDGEEVRAGESWDRGVIILAWADIRRPPRSREEGYNVCLHEFAHQLDEENGESDGVPLIEDAGLYEDWLRVCGEAFIKLEGQIAQRRPSFLGEYASESPAEFFAVITEAFFEVPCELSQRHPELYDVLRRYYRQDPAALVMAAKG